MKTRKFDIEELSMREMEELLDENETDMWAEEINPLERQKEKIVLDDNTEFLLSISILKDGKEYNIVCDININENNLVEILKSIGYGDIGWEKYSLVQERNILD